jgi:hydroxyacylglutathione hydrolase
LNSFGKKLEDNGISNFSYLKGGFSGWKSGYNATVSEGDPNSFLDQAKVKYISSDELNKIMGTEKNIYLIDLRSNSQFTDGHIKGSANIPLNNLENEENKIPLGKKIVLYDTDGLGAFKGAVRLSDLGFFNVLNLSDGFEVWKKKGFEITK